MVAFLNTANSYPLMVKAAVPIPPDAVTVTRQLDHAADRTGEPAGRLPDGKKTKRIGTGETGLKPRTASPQSGCRSQISPWTCGAMIRPVLSAITSLRKGVNSVATT